MWLTLPLPVYPCVPLRVFTFVTIICINCLHSLPGKFDSYAG